VDVLGDTVCINATVAWDDVCDSYFQNMSSASGGFDFRPSPGLRPWTPLGDFLPWFRPPPSIISKPATGIRRHSHLMWGAYYDRSRFKIQSLPWNHCCRSAALKINVDQALKAWAYTRRFGYPHSRRLFIQWVFFGWPRYFWISPWCLLFFIVFIKALFTIMTVMWLRLQRPCNVTQHRAISCSRLWLRFDREQK